MVDLARTYFRLFALVLVATLVLSACTGASQPGASTAPSAQSGPVAGGTVTVPIGADPTLNPWSPNAFVESLFINRVIFEGITKPGKDLAPAPDLAESWTIAPDGLSWTIKLRSGVKRSDGQAFSADDVAFTFNDIVPDPNTQIAQALSGDISIMILDNKAAVDRVKSASGLAVVSRPLVQYYWLALNQTDQRFTDVKVRQAFVQAIDRQAIIKSVELGYGSIANSPITPALAAYYDPSLASKYPYDPQKAKDLLAQAGWKPGADGVLQKDGKAFQFTMDVGQRGVLEPVNALIQQDLKKVGVIVDLNTMEWNAYIQKDVVRREYTATVNWWTYPSDPDVFPYYHSSAAGKGFNIPGYQDPKLDDLLVQGPSASDLEARKAIYKQLQAYTPETLPYLFLWYPQEIDVLSSSLKGVPELGLRDAVQYIGEWWLAKK